MSSDKQRSTIHVSPEVYQEFKRIASTKSFNRTWYSEAIEEAMCDYILKNGGSI